MRINQITEGSRYKCTCHPGDADPDCPVHGLEPMEVGDALDVKPGVAEGHADQQRKVFKKNGQPVGEVGIDRESSPGVGQWYMKYYATGDDFSGYDSMEEAVADLKHLVSQFKSEGSLNEFAAGGGGGSGDYLRALASAWYNGTFDSGSLQKGIKSQEDVERLLNRGIVCPDGKTRKLHIDYNSDFDGVEIYSDDYYEHGDLDGNDGRTGQPWGPYDHMEFKDEELDEGVAEGYSLGKVLTLPELLEQIKHILSAKHSGIGWRMTMPAENTFLFSAQNDYDVWSMLVVEPGGDDWVAVGHGMVDPDGKPIIFDRQQLPMTLASASEIADEAIQTYHDIDLSDYADDEDYNQGMAEGSLNEFAPDSNDGGEEDILHKYARMWWAGDEATQMQIERALAKMGWEIGEDEGSYDNGGVFVVRAGDINGRSYQSWPAEELTEGSDPFGPQGRYVGDTGPAQISTTVPRHEFRAGDRVMYKPTGAHARIENLYKNGTVARIHVASGMGGQYFDAKVADLRPIGQGPLREKSTSQAQFRTMAAAAHDPKFARKVGIKPSVAREFNRADTGQDYKDLPKKATEGATVTTTPGSIEPGGAVDNFKQQMANNTERDMAEGNRKPAPPEADYGDDYQDMVKRVKKLAGLGPLKTVYDPAKRVYRNMPTAVQPKK